MDRTGHPAASVASALTLLEARGLVNPFGGATFHPTLAAKRLARIGMTRHGTAWAMLVARTSSPPTCPRKGGPNPHGVCLLRPIRTVKSGRSPHPFESLGTLLSSHRAITRVSLAALSFTLIIAFSSRLRSSRPARESATRCVPNRCCPRAVGVGVPTDAAVTIPFDAAMDPGSVESAFQVLPDQPVRAAWSENLDPADRRPGAPVAHRRDVPGRGRRAGATHRRPAPRCPGARRFSFTTQTAPTVSDFQVRLATTDAAPARSMQQLDAKAEALLEADALRPSQARRCRRRPRSRSARPARSRQLLRGDGQAGRRGAASRSAPRCPASSRGRVSELVFTPDRAPEAGQPVHDQRHRRARRLGQRARRQGQLLVHRAARRAGHDDDAGGGCGRRRAGRSSSSGSASRWTSKPRTRPSR